MEGFARPIVVVSRCLGFDACRHDGARLQDKVTERLSRHAEIVTVCPEVEIGLGVPRPVVRLVERDGDVRMLQPSTERDLTDDMRSFSVRFLDQLAAADGFLLKNRSPSCGIRDAKVYAKMEPSPALRGGPGLFAAAVLDRFPLVPVEDEGRLSNFDLRHHFLTRLFTRAEFRERVEADEGMGALVAFHSRHKHLLMAFHQGELRLMGPIVANPQRRPAREVIADYREHLDRALARTPRYTSAINVLQHGFGYVSEELGAEERRWYLDLLEQYRERVLPLSAVLTPLQGWILRYKVDYLQQQSFFRPYPVDLMELRDSAKDRGARFRL